MAAWSEIACSWLTYPVTVAALENTVSGFSGTPSQIPPNERWGGKNKARSEPHLSSEWGQGFHLCLVSTCHRKSHSRHRVATDDTMVLDVYLAALRCVLGCIESRVCCKVCCSYKLIDTLVGSNIPSQNAVLYLVEPDQGSPGKERSHCLVAPLKGLLLSFILRLQGLLQITR